MENHYGFGCCYTICFHCGAGKRGKHTEMKNCGLKRRLFGPRGTVCRFLTASRGRIFRNIMIKKKRNRIKRFQSLGKRNREGFCASGRDRKSTRLNSSHVKISYAVFCLKKKNNSEEEHN